MRASGACLPLHEAGVFQSAEIPRDCPLVFPESGRGLVDGDGIGIRGRPAQHTVNPGQFEHRRPDRFTIRQEQFIEFHHGSIFAANQSLPVAGDTSTNVRISMVIDIVRSLSSIYLYHFTRVYHRGNGRQSYEGGMRRITRAICRSRRRNGSTGGAARPMKSPQLTPAERRIAELLLGAHSDAAMARILNRSIWTIKHHLQNMLRKFELSESARFAPRLKLTILIHEQRNILGVRCESCLNESVKLVPYSTRGLSGLHATAYCLKCGEQGQPQPAVGLDEDGEAACVTHSVTARIPANLESPDSSVPTRLQTAKKEKTEMANEPKLCACGCGSELPDGYKWPRLRGHASQGNGSHGAASQGNGKAHRSSPAPKSAPEPPAPPVTQTMVTLRLPVAKVEKLFALLLQ